MFRGRAGAERLSERELGLVVAFFVAEVFRYEGLVEVFRSGVCLGQCIACGVA